MTIKVFCNLKYVGEDVDTNLHLVLSKDNKVATQRLILMLRELMGKEITMYIAPHVSKPYLGKNRRTVITARTEEIPGLDGEAVSTSELNPDESSGALE